MYFCIIEYKSEKSETTLRPYRRMAKQSTVDLACGILNSISSGVNLHSGHGKTSVQC